MNLALRIYRWLARAFPHEFKLVYGTDVIQLGEDVVEDVSKQHGVAGLFRLVADIAIRVPIEYLAEMRRDLVYAVRTLLKSRGFTAVGLISLGLGIGVAAVGVSETLNLFLRDTPGAQDPDRLVMLNGVSYPYFEHYRDQKDLFSAGAAVDMAVPFNVALGTGVKSDRIFGQIVSPEFFATVGTTAARGRVFSPEADKSGSEPVVFITDRFWRERMDSDPNAVGRTIRVNGQTATIVGVGPKDFLGLLPFIPADLFVPTTSPAAMAPELSGDAIHQRGVKEFAALLRMAPGVTMESAEAGLDTLTRHLDEDTLDPARNAKGRRVTLLPGGKVLPIPKRMVPMILTFMALLDGLIVTIACMNLANMQLARATARRREVAIRISVGASRFRLIRQLLTESVLLAIGGGALGILIAYWVAHVIRGMHIPVGVPVNMDFTPDWRAIVIVFAISLIAGIGFGLAPALASTKTDLASTLKESSAGQLRGHRKFGMRNVLMVMQVAGSLTLLLIAGFLILGYQKLNNIEIAFDPSSMVLLSLDPVRDGYAADKVASLFDTLPEKLRAVPGVREAVLTEAVPFQPQAAVATLSIPSQDGLPEQVVSGVAKNTIGANYFASLSVSMVEGREFDMRDQRLDVTPSTVLPVVINQTAAHAFFGNADPLGRRISDSAKAPSAAANPMDPVVHAAGSGSGRSYTVVGVVKDLSAPMSQTDVAQAASTVPAVYLPLTRGDFAHPPANGMIVMVRADRGPDAMEGVRRELSEIDPNLSIFNVKTLAQQVDENQSYVRLGTFTYTGIGLFGLVLAAIGLAGVTAYSVARRRKSWASASRLARARARCSAW